MALVRHSRLSLSTMPSPVLCRISLRSALLTLLFGCQGAAEPGPTQLPAEAIVAEPEVEPEPEPPTWADVRAALPGAQDYAPTVHADPPAWLDEVDTLWLRVGDECRPITLGAREPQRSGASAGSADLVRQSRAASLEQCHEVVRKADVVCTVSFDVGHTFRETGFRTCSATLPSGAGSSSMGGSDDGALAWSLVAADETQLRYVKAWTLWVEAEHLIWIKSECTAASVTALTDALVTEGISEQARPEALKQRHGVVGHTRRCMEHFGVRLQARRSTVRDYGDRGAGVRTELGEHDCTIACPDTAHPLRWINAVLTGQLFVSVGDSATLVLHRMRSSCEATADGGLPPLASEPCRVD